MNRLEQDLADPASTPQERRRKLGGDVSELEQESDSVYRQAVIIHRFCAERGWDKSRPLFHKWLTLHFKTPDGRRDLERCADYMREADFGEWEGALTAWKKAAGPDLSA
jgi:hypothetical protein